MLNKKLADALNMPEEEIEGVYKEMLKVSVADKQLNCGACGYNTCEQMVAAIILGTKSKENCVYYHKIRATIDSLNEFITNTSEMLEVIKKASAKFAVFSEGMDKHLDTLGKLKKNMKDTFNGLDNDQ